LFGLGFWELVVIAVVALLFIGPDRLPNFFRALGRATREFQRASRELRENLSIDEPPPARKPPVRRPPTDVAAHPGSVPRGHGRSVELPPDPGDGLARTPGGSAPEGAPEPAGVRPPAAAQHWPTAEDADRRAREAASGRAAAASAPPAAGGDDTGSVPGPAGTTGEPPTGAGPTAGADQGKDV
jgi:TatA/E family protein of Tat protein translocase